jgi:hypothetical protein
MEKSVIIAFFVILIDHRIHAYYLCQPRALSQRKGITGYQHALYPSSLNPHRELKLFDSLHAVNVASTSHRMFIGDALDKPFSHIRLLSRNVIAKMKHFLQSYRRLLLSVMLFLMLLAPMTMRPASAVSGGVISGSSRSRDRSPSTTPSRSSRSRTAPSRDRDTSSSRSRERHDHFSRSSSLIVGPSLGTSSLIVMNGKSANVLNTIVLGSFVLVMVSSNPAIKSKLRAQFGINRATLHYVQTCFAVREEEKKAFIEELAAITSIKRNQQQDGDTLIDIVFDISVSMMRLLQNHALVNARMEQWRYPDSIKNRKLLDQKFDQLAILEQAKFRPSPAVEDPLALSNLMVTILIAASGPVMINQGWNIHRQAKVVDLLRYLRVAPAKKIKVPKSHDLERYVLELPTYLRDVNHLGLKAIDDQDIDYEDDVDMQTLAPEFKIKLIWLPNKVSS